MREDGFGVEKDSMAADWFDDGNPGADQAASEIFDLTDARTDMVVSLDHFRECHEPMPPCPVQTCRHRYEGPQRDQQRPCAAR